jgi:ABC-type multidrug transport system permease subunit
VTDLTVLQFAGSLLGDTKIIIIKIIYMYAIIVLLSIMLDECSMSEILISRLIKIIISCFHVDPQVMSKKKYLCYFKLSGKYKNSLNRNWSNKNFEYPFCFRLLQKLKN